MPFISAIGRELPVSDDFPPLVSVDQMMHDAAIRILEILEISFKSILYYMF